MGHASPIHTKLKRGKDTSIKEQTVCYYIPKALTTEGPASSRLHVTHPDNDGVHGKSRGLCEGSNSQQLSSGIERREGESNCDLGAEGMEKRGSHARSALGQLALSKLHVICQERAQLHL